MAVSEVKSGYLISPTSALQNKAEAHGGAHAQHNKDGPSIEHGRHIRVPIRLEVSCIVVCGILNCDSE